MLEFQSTSGSLVAEINEWISEDNVWAYRNKKLLRSKKILEYTEQEKLRNIYNKWYMKEHNIEIAH